MRITKAAIRKIIREEVDGELPKDLEDIETVEGAWAGGENLELDVDYSKTSTDEPNVATPEVLELVVAEVRRRLSEEAKTTKKYDDSKHLKGDQDKLPDHLQKGIIDKALEEVDGSGGNQDLYGMVDRLLVYVREALPGHPVEKRILDIIDYMDKSV